MKNYCVAIFLGFLGSAAHGADVTAAFYQAYHQSPSFYLFKKPADLNGKQHPLLQAAQKLSQDAAALEGGIFADHAKKIEIAIQQLFSAINSIRRHIKDVAESNDIRPTDQQQLLDNHDASGQRRNWKKELFEKLNKTMITGFIKKLEKAQSDMNGKFSFLSNIKYKNNALYQQLKSVASSVDGLIKKFIKGSGGEMGYYPELVSLMKK
jgi:hypothetical protein